MTAFAQRSFSSGEISPALYPRVDQAKYASGLKTCRNFVVARNGGAYNRPGTGFVAEVKDSNSTVRLIPFVFSTDQTYVLEFGSQYLRIYDDGGQVLESAKIITGATQANPCVVTSTAHGYSNGDEVYITGVAGMTQLNGRNFKINNVAANTFELLYMDGTNVNSTAFTAYSSAGTVARVYTVGTPYTEDALQDIQFVQSADVITLVHPNYAPRTLSRTSATAWVMAEIVLAPSISAPVITVSGGAGTASVYVATGVMTDSYEESLPSASVGSAVTASSGTPVTVTIATPSAGAIEYNIYKKTNGLYGYIGTCASGSTFVDNGITADPVDNPPTSSAITTAFSYVFSKNADPASLPAGTGNSVAWSPDGQFVAVAHATTPFVTIYQVSGSTLTKLADPATLPAGAGTGVAWADCTTKMYLIVSHATTPFMTVYSVSGTTFTKIANPSTLPTGNANGCAAVGGLSSATVVIAHDTSPFMSIYYLEASSDALTKQADPATLPTGNGQGVSYSVGGVVAVAHNTSPFVSFYTYVFAWPPSSPTWAKLANPATLPTGNGQGVSWSSDGTLVSVAHATSPFVTVYRFDSSTNTFSKITDPVTLPASTGNDCAWSSDGGLLAVSHATTPFMTVYRWDGTSFTKLSDPSALPASTGNGAGFSVDDSYLAIAHATTPFVSIYSRSFAAPGAVTLHQQRMLFANTGANPQTAWASRIGSYKNFTISSPTVDDNAVIFTIAGRQVNRIKHMLSLNRLVLFTETGEHTADGDAAGMITPTSINLSQQSYNGSGALSPLVVGGSAVFVQARGTKIRDLGFDQQVEGYTGGDLTIFSTHLFDGHTIRDWAFQQEPNSVIWAVRDDGILLGCTFVREQQILAWHRHDFDGTVEQVCTVPEGNEDAVYLVIKRTINGATKRYIERMKTRQFSDIKDLVMVDCSLSYDGRNTSETFGMTISGGTTWDYTETLTLTATSAYFSAADVGNEIQLTSTTGTVVRFRIYGYTSSTIVTGRVNVTVPADLRSAATADWAKAVDDLTNLWHLEGKQISVSGDGFVVASPNNAEYAVLTVTNGAVTLPRPYTVIHAGLPITSDMRTLDIDTANGETSVDKLKLITKVALHVQESRGIWVGEAPPTDDDTDPLENLKEMQASDDTDYDTPVSLETDILDVQFGGSWNKNGNVFIRQVDPIPVTVLAAVPIGMVPLGR